MTPDLSDYERATVERIDAAEAAPESLRERVARAMWEAQAAHGSFSFPCRCGWDNNFGAGWEDRQDRHRHMAVADAAIAVMRGEL